MNWPVRSVRIRALWAACLLLAGCWPASAQADGPTLKAVFGLAGHYRPGTWCPVTVTIQNPSSDTLTGQAQVLASNDLGRANNGSAGGNSALTGALFARPVSVSGSSQSVVVYTRGIDPGRDSVTVQLAEGRERGNGRILAQTTNEPSNITAPTVTGTPVGDNDLFLVGFSSDPGAFTYLSSKHFGLAHNPGGFVSAAPLANPRMAAPVQMPVSIQVAAAGALDLPDKAAGYSGVDAFLLRSDAPLDALTEAQADALKDWVASGGHLIVCGGIDSSRFASSFFTGLLPATVGAFQPTLTMGLGFVGGLPLTPKPLPGVKVLPGAVSGPYGAGRVTITAFDPAAKAFQTSGMETSEWGTLLTDGQALPSSILSHVAAREENYAPNYGYGGEGGQLLSDAVMRAPSLDAPGTEVIGLFLLVYLIALVPVNYLILKRLDRKELAWVTIPAIVVLFAVGTFGVGYAAKGGSVFVNRAAIVETTSGQRDAGVYTELGLFSPHRTSYDITIPGANALAAIPNPGFSYGRRGDAAQSYGQTRFVETGDGAALQDTAVNMWAMRAFDTQSTTNLGGTVDAALTEKPGPPLPANMTMGMGGTVTNHTPFALTQCAVVCNGQWQQLPDLAPGMSAPVSVAAPPNGLITGQPGLQIPQVGPGIDKNDAQSDIRQRMRAALADYARSLGDQNNNNYYGYNGQPRMPSYSPAPEEALFLGWSNDPALAGPAPRIDGHSVRENDVTLVIVHLPVAPSPVTD